MASQANAQRLQQEAERKRKEEILERLQAESRARAAGLRQALQNLQVALDSVTAHFI